MVSRRLVELLRSSINNSRKRSGAERDTLRRGEPAVAGCCVNLFGVPAVFKLVLGIKGIKKGIGKRTVVVKPGMPGP
jgi:hypothetical protein